MWDCQYRSQEDRCRKRKEARCYPGALGCVLEGKFRFPFQKDLKKHKAMTRIKKRSDNI